MEAITVIIAENELAEREKLKSLLANETDIQVIGEARDGRECLDLARRQRPTVALIKEDLPVLNGLACAEQISTEIPEVGVILILTGSEGEEVWHKMLRAGIREFMTRPITSDRLLEEVRKVARVTKAPKKPGAPGAAEPEVAKRRIITVYRATRWFRQDRDRQRIWPSPCRGRAKRSRSST